MALNLAINNKIEVERVIKIAPFKKEIRITNPHKHNSYLELVYLSKGSGFHFIDLNKYSINPPVLFFIRQEQVHYWHLDTEPDGYVIIIKKAFVEKSLDRELKALFTKTSSQNCLELPDNKTIEKLFELLTEEYNDHGANMSPVLEGLLKSLLAKVVEVCHPAFNNEKVTSDLYQCLIQLLDTENGIKRKVSYYAEKLNTTPQNLNAACQKIASKSAAEVLSDFVVNEAKRLLMYTDKTISQISYDQGFLDPSHFVKYFKKTVGVTPHAFRSQRS
jgi:AraC-like DNA-binding protein